MPRGTRPAFTSPMGPILQVKMRLIGISPMIWRRVLLPVASTLEELHGVIQAAMGWEGPHLYEFRIRSARYGSPDLCAGAADMALASLRFRRHAKVSYVYDMGDWWEHEIRIEDRLEAEDGRRYPFCVGEHGACPPEDCGGPAGYQARRDEALGFAALEDLDTMATLLKAIVLDGRHELLDDEDRRCQTAHLPRHRDHAGGAGRHQSVSQRAPQPLRQLQTRPQQTAPAAALRAAAPATAVTAGRGGRPCVNA